MRYLKQTDLRWRFFKLGESKFSIGSDGCTTTDLSMLSDFFHCYMSPRQIAGMKDWYTKNGLIIWNKLDFVYMRFRWRIYSRNDELFKEYLKNPDTALIFQVNAGRHWVLPIKFDQFKNDYIAVDPLTGMQCEVLRKYKEITGAALFQRRGLSNLTSEPYGPKYL